MTDFIKDTISVLFKIPVVVPYTEEEKANLRRLELEKFYKWSAGVITNEGYVPLGHPLDVSISFLYAVEVLEINFKFPTLKPTGRVDVIAIWIKDHMDVMRYIKPFCSVQPLLCGDMFKPKFKLHFTQSGTEFADIKDIDFDL